MGNQRGPGGRAAIGRPAPRTPFCSGTLVESFGRQRFSRSDGKSRLNPAAGEDRPRTDRRRGKSEGRPERGFRPRRSAPEARRNAWVVRIAIRVVDPTVFDRSHLGHGGTSQSETGTQLVLAS